MRFQVAVFAGLLLYCNPFPEVGNAEAPPSAQQGKGVLLSFDFQDADIHSVLRILSEASGMNIITHKEVQGKISMRLRDVSWQQALTTLARMHSLRVRQNGNVILLIPYEEVIKSAQ